MNGVAALAAEAGCRCEIGGGAVISYLEAGMPGAGGTPLVMLHGIGSAARSFRAQLGGLSALRRIIAWDAPGYGGSTGLLPPAPDADDYAAMLAAFLDTLKIARCHLLGHSLGCLIAARFARRNPARVRSLILCAIATGHGPLPAGERRKLLDQRINDVNTLGPWEMAKRRGPRLVSPKSPPGAAEKVIEAMRTVHPGGYVQAARMLSTGDVKADVSALPQTLPLRIIYGEDDVITPPARNLEVAALRPASVVAIPAAGHAVYLEQPAALNAAIERFLVD